MAYAALVSLAQLLEQIIHHHRFFCIPLSEKRKLESLQEKVSFLQAFLDNYSHKDGQTVQSLEPQIREAAYQAQDIIENHISDQVRSDYEFFGVKRGFRQLVYTVGEIVRRTIPNKYGKELLKALENIDSIVTEVTDIQISCRVEEVQISHTSAPASPNGGNKMVGFDEDLIGIKERLCGESSQLKVIPIVGMGGIGKTTLARNIFDDSLVAYHFHTRAWITISQEYHLREILLRLLDSLPVNSELLSKKQNEELMEIVYRSLKGRTYLIIMDDMWSPDAWDDLRRIFPDDNNGSRIVITTRLTDVAEYASSSPIHQMQFLNEDQSWHLLRDVVFGEQSCPPELEEIGRVIAKNCGGLPLAIAVVAGILTKVDRTQHEWKNIAENTSSVMATTDEHCSKILSLSFDHLPHYLKACFLYMGVFPEDYEIHASNLIMLWVAEGFLRPIGSKSSEEVAEEYLEDLVKRNLVLITKKRINGKIKLCGIHDLLRDLCIRKAQDEKFLDVYTYGSEVDNLRRLSIRPHNSCKPLTTNTSASPVRSVLHFDKRDIFSFALRLRLVRVLDILYPSLEYFPIEITELFHLRYLAFAYYNERKKPLALPPAISKLQSLQTLIIHYFWCYSFPEPFQIWKIPQLRHLIVRGYTFRIALAPRIDGQFHVLENLRTLSPVENFKLTRKAIDMIPNLKKLDVRYTVVSKSRCSKLGLNNLAYLHQLETLNLKFYDDPSPWKRRFQPYFTVSCYALPPNLKKLSLRRCGPPSNNMSIIGSLSNLEVLKLELFDFVEFCWDCNEGEFPRLKFLQIAHTSLRCWRAESTHFPCLQHLIIRYCRDLEEIPGAIGDITTLKLIEVGPDSKSAADSAVAVQEEQESLGNEVLQIRLHERA